MSTVELTNASRWYGNVVAVNDVTMTLGPGVTGLLGPNGAGKTTLLHMMSGFLAPSQGTLTVDGRPAWRNPDVYRTLGLVSEREAVHGFLTAWEFVLASPGGEDGLHGAREDAVFRTLPPMSATASRRSSVDRIAKTCGRCVISRRIVR